MDRERKKRLQTIRLIITEVIMVISIVALVIVLTFVAMGYNVDKNGEVGQSGLLQVRSIPTGAIIEIDDEVISARTNTSKMLPAGDHKIKLTRAGYDTWEKSIVSESGWLLKLDYPRLFYQDRTVEKMREYSSDIDYFSVSPNHEYVLYHVASASEWTLMSVGDSNNITESNLNIAKFVGDRKIINYTWNNNSDKILIKSEKDNKYDWVLINVNNIDKSVNLTEAFGMDFSDMIFSSDNGESLTAIENGNLRAVMASDRTLSQVLAADIKTFSQDENRIIYQTNKNEVKLYQEGSDDILLAAYRPEQKVNIAFGEYLSKKYIVISVDKEVFYYRGVLPTKDNTLSDMELALKKELNFIPDELFVHSRDELYIAKTGKDLAVYDAELNKLSGYTVESDQIFFLDDSLLGVTNDGRMIIRDFDGENRRDLTSATGSGFITKDSRYLIYQKSDRGSSAILREKILE